MNTTHMASSTLNTGRSKDFQWPEKLLYPRDFIGELTAGIQQTTTELVQQRITRAHN